MGFWERLSFSLALAARDAAKEKRREEEKIQNARNKAIKRHFDALADNYGTWSELITGVVEEANPSYIASEIYAGLRYTPIYIYLKVLRVQGSMPTNEQKKMLDLYFNNMTLEFTQTDYLAAIFSENAVSRKVKETVEVTPSFAGVFWQEFFRALYKTNRNTKILCDIENCINVFAVEFSALSEMSNHEAFQISRQFGEGLKIQASECRKLPTKDIDFIGEEHYLEHKKKMNNIAMSLLYSAGQQDELQLDEILPNYYVAILKEVIDRSTRNQADKAMILDEAINICNINIDFSGYDIYLHFNKKDELYDFLSVLPTSMITIMFGLGSDSHREDDAMTFFKEMYGFLVGVEQELNNKYPFSGFEGIAKKYFDETLKRMEKVIS